MTPVDAYVADLVAALNIKESPLDSTRVANVPHCDLLAELRSATLGYLATPAAFSTNARLLDGDCEVPRAARPLANGTWPGHSHGAGERPHRQRHHQRSAICRRQH